jgi:2-polyprenyl-3-methyl-5-hydroxy-6-metoxy-1,4-benzoquinol methylase
MKDSVDNKNFAVKGDLNGLLSGYLIRKRQAVIRPYLKGRKRVLDVGCGIFRWQGLLPPESEYVGIDCEKSIIEYNRAHYAHKFFTVNINQDDCPDLGTNFDIVMLAAVIEHLDHPEAALKRLAQFLQPGGILVLTTPHPMGNLILNCGAKIGIFSKDKHQHHDLLSRQRINEIIDINTFELISYRRFLCGFNQLAVIKKIQSSNV